MDPKTRWSDLLDDAAIWPAAGHQAKDRKAAGSDRGRQGVKAAMPSR
jgi:hypothetical protein